MPYNTRMSKFWDWIKTEEKVIKPFKRNPPLEKLSNRGDDFYLPRMVSDYTERQLQEMYPPLKDAYEQYQILLKMYDSKHKTKFQKARSL